MDENYIDNAVNGLDMELDIVNAVDRIRIPRNIRRTNLFEEYTPVQFLERFRLSKESVYKVLIQLEDRLEYYHNRNYSISPINQILICLRVYATGGHFLSIGDHFGPSKSSVCRILKKVTPLIASLRDKYIYMPKNGHEILKEQNKFFKKKQFPRIIGCIDCTHIKIQSPGGDDAEIFRNRKGYFSINVQAICSSDLQFHDIVARWPGSAHDCTIFRNSLVKGRFDREDFGNALLLGDGGYLCRKYLLTPLKDPQTDAERRYNEAHIGTRVIVEQLFGVWKRRFPILAYGCRLNLNLTLQVIVAAAVLHNIARIQGDPNPKSNNEIIDEPMEIDTPPNELNGINFRRAVIENYFSNI